MISVSEVEVNRLFVGKSNVRRDTGDLTELVASIKENGVLYPIVVRPVGKKFEVIVGSRRLAAARKLKLSKVPAIVRPLKDADALIESLIENIQRGELELDEEAEAYESLVKRLGSIREVEKHTGISKLRIADTLEAMNAARKLKTAGIRITSRLPNTSEDRASGNAMPKLHAIELERAFKTDLVNKLPEKEKQEKYFRLAKTVAPLAQQDARKILNEFKMYPEESIEELQSRAGTRLSGVSLQTYLPPSMAKELDQIARERASSIEEILPEIVQKGLSEGRTATSASSDNAIVISEIDTGFVFACPVCHDKYKIIHTKPTNGHKFEDVK